jgi:hypothetical protein
MSEDSIISRIMAGISIPAAELGVAPVRPQPAPVAAGTSVATAESIAAAETARQAANAERLAKQTRTAEVRKPVETAAAPAKETTKDGGKPAKTKSDPVAAKPGTARGKAAVASADVDEEPATAAKPKKAPAVDPKKALAERKAAEAKKLADVKKAADAKKAADEAKAAKADPPRIWVQVAGGANESDLPKAWSTAKTKAEALKGRAAYSTPLRATNRVVTGSFKTDAEALAFINTLSKQGVSAFPFTSEKGQKMKKLGEK